MKYSEEEAICEITAFYWCPDYQMAPEVLYKNIALNKAVKVFRELNLNDILKRLDIVSEQIPSGSGLNLFLILLSDISDNLEEDNPGPVLLQKHWGFP